VGFGSTEGQRKGMVVEMTKTMKFYGGPKDGLEWVLDHSKRVTPPKKVRFEYEDTQYVYANRPESGEALTYYLEEQADNGHE
jgi:hypothetical protein